MDSGYVQGRILGWMQTQRRPVTAAAVGDVLNLDADTVRRELDALWTSSKVERTRASEPLYRRVEVGKMLT